MLSKEQKHILFEEGTESPGASPLNYEKREGDYLCVDCGTKLLNLKIQNLIWPINIMILFQMIKTLFLI